MLLLLFALGATATPIAEYANIEARAAAADSSYFNSLVNGLAAGKCPAAVSPGNTEMIPCSRVTDDCNKGLSALNQVLGVNGAACPDPASSFDQKALQTAFASYASPFCNPLRTVTSTTTFTSTIKETITTLRPASTTTVSKCTATSTADASTVTSTVTSTAAGAQNTVTQTVSAQGSCATAPSATTSSATTTSVTTSANPWSWPSYTPPPPPDCAKAIKGTQDFNTFTVGTSGYDRNLYVGGFTFSPDVYNDISIPTWTFVSDGKGGTAFKALRSLSIERQNSTSEAFYLKSFDVECNSAACQPRQIRCRSCIDSTMQEMSFSSRPAVSSNYTTYEPNTSGPWLQCGIYLPDSVGVHGWDNFVFSN